MSDLTVAVLGTGIMGAGMARSLLREGIGVRAWNRTRAKAEPLAADGARVCDEPAEAVAGARVVLTMLRDGETVEQVMSGALAAIDEDTVWAQTSTVGAEPADRLAHLAADRDVPYFDAPVLGTKQPAEEGKLLVMVSGPTAHRERVQPVFDAIGTRTVWVGEGTEASRLKLVVNSWVLALTAAVGETMALADGLGLDPKLFLEAIAGGPLDVQYAHAKGGAILSGEFPASFKTETAVKDMELVVRAARAAGLTPLLAEAVRDQMRRTVQLGHGDDDMAAVYHAARTAS
ncbi:MAG TPA: NAD(P)-dependent oxidoreductase [Streptosporangiaceae bacterium]